MQPTQSDALKLRSPDNVMRLARLGCFHQSRLSFMRILLRRLKAENWRFERPEFQINEYGVGHAVYTCHGPERSYSLVAFAHDLPDEQRSDRVIAEAWDATFTLFDGVPDHADIKRLSENVPLQEAGRISEKELSLSRANKSARLWSQVVNSLAAGQQPDAEELSRVGYLMRTTAVYGSGKFGAADRETVADRDEFAAPFQVEMLSVYLTRTFVRDLVEYMASIQNPKSAVKLEEKLARALGIGNSTGLGMAPFLLNHPNLLNNWITARETAVGKVAAVATAQPEEISTFLRIFERAILSLKSWQSQHPIQIKKLKDLNGDVARLSDHLKNADLANNHPWQRLLIWSENSLGMEGQEFLNSLILEPYAHIVDDLAQDMSAPVGYAKIDGAQTISEMLGHIRANYSWAIQTDWKDPANTARAWYVSEEKLEPRLGERFEELIGEYEQPLSPARDVARCYEAMKTCSPDSSVAEFLLSFPEHRHIVRRIQKRQSLPYGEIYDNTISTSVLPIDMLRCKLSFFGAIHFDPRSDRWVRICMYANAPYPEELAKSDADFWIYPDVNGAA